MANHHEVNSPYPCKLCEEKLLTCHPTLGHFFNLIKKTFPLVHISWGWRGESDQELFFAMGKTKCRWPNSKHNEMKDGKPFSLAMDLFEIGQDQVARFNMETYSQISQYLKTLQAPLQWSGDWKGFKEFDHYQVVENEGTLGGLRESER